MTTDIHRYLDERFAGITVTPEIQDLKEEIRANLVARVDELTAAGVDARSADERAMAELGDIDDLLASDRAAESDHGMTPPESDGVGQAHGRAADRVRVVPKPGFVLRAVAWAVLLVAALTLAVLGATDVLALPVGPIIGLAGLAATAIGLLVGDSLTQETTANHPMHQPRAAAYALASWCAFFGLALGGLIALGVLPLWCLVFAVLAVVGAAAGFIVLGVTQTNRHKPWARSAQFTIPANRFTTEPEVAARFGIYCGAIWIVVAVTAAVLVFTVGWQWVPIPFGAGLATMCVTLATMMFPASGGSARH